MKGINDLIEQLKDSGFASRLQGCESIDEFVRKANELGYDISVEEVENATDLPDEVLESVAGGYDAYTPHKYTC